ncbi:hypothetical protein BAUCODRAFT_119752 [Baudoinia panamericana UAMH 10762]|uniref:Uncharacterized protein n=1 Tax=Baudoinia panamericana (strain UAMH 10762) TaxID=717646 RepID=M2NM02_BAUPA|nr:uncharacterized protein BAUCODRAFT_119752 [Baudoinia panamericana UAMH 10762]EMD00201.1 hypothetical protein BAUCODRAFT_119752 [Baudoinia panamericana UAMH 10762]
MGYELVISLKYDVNADKNEFYHGGLFLDSRYRRSPVHSLDVSSHYAYVLFFSFASCTVRTLI